MRAWWAVTRRETAAFFDGAVATVVMAAFLALAGFGWLTAVFDYAELSRSALTSGRTVSATLNLHDGVFMPTVAGMALILLMIMPAVTMRLFAEEYRSRRSDLIFTWPVDDGVWVLGKWAAATATAMLLVLAASPLLIATGFFAAPETGPLFASLLGLVLTAAFAAAWGLVFSAAVSHQLTAWLLGFAFALGTQWIAHLEPHLPQALSGMGMALSLPAHLERFTQGVIELRDVVFFVGGTALALATAATIVTGRRLAGARRGARWPVVAVLALMVAVGGRLAESAHLRLDLTPDGRRSLAPQSTQVLTTLRDDVHVVAFYQRLDPNRLEAERLLRAFSEASDRFTYEVRNPDVDLAAVREHGITTPRSVVVTAGDRRRTVVDPDEGALVNAAFRAAEGTAPVVYYVMGHGEPALDGDDRGGFRAFTETLGREGYRLRPLVMGAEALIPGDASVVVLASPEQEYLTTEIAALHAFAARGGGVLGLLDPGSPAALTHWASVYNVRLGDDFVVSDDDATRRVARDLRAPVLVDYPGHEITRGLTGMATFFPFAQSLHPIHDGMVGLEARTVLATGDRAWGERDVTQLGDNAMVYDEGVDEPGPLPLAVALEIDRDAFFDEGRLSALAGVEETTPASTVFTETLRRVQQARRYEGGDNIFARRATSRVLIVGDSDFAANSSLNLWGNRDLLLNMIGWLAREQTLISVRARTGAAQPLTLEPGRGRELLMGIGAWTLLASALTATRALLRRRR